MVPVEASVKRQYWKPEIENLDKWEHLAMFFILAVLASLAYRQHLALKIFFTLVLLSICEQVLQSLSITRDADVADFSFDLLGVTLGSLFAFGGRRIALIRWPLTSGRVDSS
jgi:VanZ family protein